MRPRSTAVRWRAIARRADLAFVQSLVLFGPAAILATSAMRLLPFSVEAKAVLAEHFAHAIRALVIDALVFGAILFALSIKRIACPPGHCLVRVATFDQDPVQLHLLLGGQ